MTAEDRAVPIRTRSLREPREPGDGHRLLITRFRPRGVRKEQESWDAWDRRLAPSAGLVKAFQSAKKTGDPLRWAEYADRFVAELRGDEGRAALDELHARSASGETITLLCHCDDETRCHRGIVRRLEALRRASKG
jgi:uncharacterized protein YeaO (DUF488 family)